MSTQPTVYIIDDILKGYNNASKLKNFYVDLRKQVLPQKPIQKSEVDAVTIKNSERANQYGWELFKTNDSLVMVEYLRDWQGYAHQARKAPSIGKESFKELQITIHNSNKDLESKIKKIISSYPARSKK